ncbi:MAG TPA: multicopper oxidase domain-containing protein [Candidatus Baltobacteraceae bacterium]|jgi:ZIP family zinc transporter|nr:multicopper oxidase domain-containing protein [Candidatus Baltobacteraceae bacterium]
MHPRFARFVSAAAVSALLLAFAYPIAVSADADEPGGAPASTSAGLQPIRGAIPAATPAPGESASFLRPDGAYQAIPSTQGRTKTFHLVERAAPWTLQPGLTVMANTYNGVVPGPTMVVHEGDTVVIDYTNDGPVPDTVHLHGVHDIPDTMDGVGGISQSLVPIGGHFVYKFVANQPGTLMYHSHDNEEMVDSGLYGAIIVEPSQPRPNERGLAHDFLEIVSSWMIQSTSENHFTLNGKEYPATRQLDVRKGERFRIRWINISGEEFHTMHTHGHYQQIVARDAAPVDYRDIQDTVFIAPGQRVDVVVDANARPGTWLVHCHVLDHIQDASGMPDGLITAIHYVGTPNVMASMYRAMMPVQNTSKKALSFGMTVLLGAIAGFTIFLGLPIARARRLSAETVALLNALAIGILLYLVVEIAQSAILPISTGVNAWHAGTAAFPAALIFVFVAGLLIGLVGLGSAATHFARRAAAHADNPVVLAAIIAIGIGAHNFGEGLAIGASAASGATAVAVALIIGFGLHNATEGFGVAAPLVGRVVPSWAQIGLAGLIAGGPTFIGTILGYSFYSPVLSVLFLAIAIGALVFVIGELWSVLRRTGLTAFVTATMCAGFLIAMATELFVDVNGG